MPPAAPMTASSQPQLAAAPHAPLPSAQGSSSAASVAAAVNEQLPQALQLLPHHAGSGWAADAAYAADPADVDYSCMPELVDPDVVRAQWQQRQAAQQQHAPQPAQPPAPSGQQQQQQPAMQHLAGFPFEDDDDVDYDSMPELIDPALIMFHRRQQELLRLQRQQQPAGATPRWQHACVRERCTSRTTA